MRTLRSIQHQVELRDGDRHRDHAGRIADDGRVQPLDVAPHPAGVELRRFVLVHQAAALNLRTVAGVDHQDHAIRPRKEAEVCAIHQGVLNILTGDIADDQNVVALHEALESQQHRLLMLLT